MLPQTSSAATTRTVPDAPVLPLEGPVLQLAHKAADRSEATGIVQKIVTADDFARYELAQDLTEHHHHHRVCSACGGVEDFTLPDALEATLDKALGRVARKAGFRLASHQLDLVGLCAACA